ncbi:MAG: hypothetical protein IPJ88_05615 [Myxococcales bacterium]|nr:MAG: hypothetical protein IPJ88_05615 [Myxococcales bacterium]
MYKSVRISVLVGCVNALLSCTVPTDGSTSVDRTLSVSVSTSSSSETTDNLEDRDEDALIDESEYDAETDEDCDEDGDFDRNDCNDSLPDLIDDFEDGGEEWTIQTVSGSVDFSSSPDLQSNAALFSTEAGVCSHAMMWREVDVRLRNAALVFEASGNLSEGSRQFGELEAFLVTVDPDEYGSYMNTGISVTALTEVGTYKVCIPEAMRDRSVQVMFRTRAVGDCTNFPELSTAVDDVRFSKDAADCECDFGCEF